jgi:hypothetical protein
MQFTWELLGSGTAKVMLGQGEKSVTIFASNLSIALGDLLDAINALLAGNPRAVFARQDEPGEWRWVLERSSDQLGIQILRFEKNFSDKPDDAGTPLVDMTCPLRQFVRRIKMALDNLLEEHGVDSYRELWVKHDFPMRGYERLAQWLAEQKP